MTSKIISQNQLKLKAIEAKKMGLSIGLCHGVFDLLHPGHYLHIEKAKSKVDVLFVTITSDEYVNKGPGRPVFSEILRAKALSLIESIDFVSIIYEESAVSALSLIQPNLYFKGIEYENIDNDINDSLNRELEVLTENGGSIYFTDEITFSSSKIINDQFEIHSQEFKLWLKDVTSQFSLANVYEYLEKLKNLNVLVIGESIFDRYSTCEILGKSSKDPLLCFNKIRSDTHAGGVLAVARNIRNLGSNVTLLSAINSQDFGNNIFLEMKEAGIDLIFEFTDPYPTIIKERFIESKSGSRVFELYSMKNYLSHPSFHQNLLSKAKSLRHKFDLVIMLDYGHGFFDSSIVEYMSNLKVFKALNVQSNGGNNSMNSVSKFRNIDYLTLNSRELFLETFRYAVNDEKYFEHLQSNFNFKTICVTEGSQGISLLSKNCAKVKSPALTSQVKDTVGAGDAVLSITSLLSYINAPLEVIALLGNIVGSWNVSFIGNSEVLDKKYLRKTLKSLLTK
jgi:rfaE bifunctional protein kinase chain/domain